MPLPNIFCAQCDALILASEQCSNCQWRRPVANTEVGKPAWAVALEAKLPRKDSHPVAAGHVAYFATEKGELVALDTMQVETEQAVLWRHQLDSRYRCYSLAVWNDVVLLGNEFAGGFPTPPGELTMLSTEKGEEVWRHQVEGASLSVPAVDSQGIAYFTVNTGWLYAVDLTSRQERWREKIPAPWSWSPAAPKLTSTGLLLLPGRTDHLFAFDIEQRKIAWTFPAGGWFAHTPHWVDGTVYVRCWDINVYAIDGTSGREIWRYKPARDYSSDLWVSAEYVHIGVKDFQGDAEEGSPAYALYTLNRRTGERVGRFETQGRILAQPVATDEAVFFATDDRSRVIERRGTFYALDRKGQNLLWEPCVVEQRFQTDLLLIGDWVVAGTRHGAVYAIPWLAVEAVTDSPQAYADRSEWEKAAIAHALHGEFAQSAGIYANQLKQPLKAGRVYLHAGLHRQVVDLLGRSEKEEEWALALIAAHSIPVLDERAQALCDMGEYQAAGRLYKEADRWEEAGDCYLAAQDWKEAQAAYAQAKVWEKWENVTRELELWQDLIDRFVDVGDYAQAAEVQQGRGFYLEAAEFYDRAGMNNEALAAYQRVTPDKMTDEASRRLLELAEKAGEADLVIEAYRALGELAKAAEAAENGGRYNRALEFYQEAGEAAKAGEMLEKLKRFAEAGDLFEQARRFGRAARSLEQQVEREIELAGGVRFVRDNPQLETWLKRAIELYEEEADYADEAAREVYMQSADRCRTSLLRIRREPVLRLSLQADTLVVDQSNAIDYEVENVGWGTARSLTLSINGTHLQSSEQFELGTLGRRGKAEGVLTVVPTLAGDITLQVVLEGQSKSGDIREVITQSISVAQQRMTGGPGVVLNTQVGHGTEGLRSHEALEAERGTLWDEGSSSESDVADSRPVTQVKLKEQRIEYTRNQLARHYTNLDKLQEQAAIYGAGMAPLELQNRIDNEMQAIEDLEVQLQMLEES